MRVLKSKVEKIKPTVAGDHAIDVDVDVDNSTNSIVVVVSVVVVSVATDNNRALVQQRDPAYLTMRLRRI